MSGRGPVLRGRIPSHKSRHPKTANTGGPTLAALPGQRVLGWLWARPIQIVAAAILVLGNAALVAGVAEGLWVLPEPAVTWLLRIAAAYWILRAVWLLRDRLVWVWRSQILIMEFTTLAVVLYIIFRLKTEFDPVVEVVAMVVLVYWVVRLFAWRYGNSVSPGTPYVAGPEQNHDSIPETPPPLLHPNKRKHKPPSAPAPNHHVHRNVLHHAQTAQKIAYNAMRSIHGGGRLLRKR
jgi:hypothetical protein